MKQVTLNVNDAKYPFFMELIKSLDFVQVQEEGDNKEAVMKNLKQGFKEMKDYQKGKTKATELNDFLDEL